MPNTSVAKAAAYATCVHEVGHALFLSHSDESQDVMYSANRTVTMPTSSDKSFLRSKWGIRYGKNKFKWMLLGCCMCFLSGGCGKGQSANKAEAQKNKVITVENIAPERILNPDAMYWGYTYEELKENADVIVKVKVLDDLTSENSLADYENETGWVIRFCSAKSVQALELYKNETELSVGDTFLVQQEALSVIWMKN